MFSDSSLYRILDAECNRAGEGLRVIEDYVRFVLDDAHLTGQVKHLRHDLAAAVRELPTEVRHAARDTQSDVGTEITSPGETRRADAWDACAASLERTKQALRSLEEYAKAAASRLAAPMEALRYRLYTLEAAIGRTVDACRRLAGVRLYVLVDGAESEAEFARKVTELAAAGADAIQLRESRLPDGELVARARILVRSTSRGSTGTLAIINNRPDVAAAAGADGVHLGQEDMSVQHARAVLGPRRLIGVSTHSIDQARAAVLGGANYLGVGPVFPSRTKSFDDFPGPQLLRQVAAEIRLPAFAIGGITLDNAPDALATGITRLAVSSAIVRAASPAEAAAQFRSLLARD
jgi:thiamine-phosphate pyrophosphorylase